MFSVYYFTSRTKKRKLERIALEKAKFEATKGGLNMKKNAWLIFIIYTLEIMKKGCKK